MSYRIDCVSEPAVGESYLLQPGARTIIGRGDQCAVRIQHMTVSRAHCVLYRSGEHWIVEDLGSTNGTYVNGLRVSESPLEVEDLLGVGKVQFRIAYYADENAQTVTLDDEIS